MSDEANAQDMERVRQIADKLDCLTEEDFILFSGATPSTVESWRRRGQGPAYILLGRRFLYPRQALRRYLDSITKERSGKTGFAAPGKDLL